MTPRRAEVVADERPAHRVVLLGASNLSISFRRVVGLVRAGLVGTVDLFAAHGHGRSYGTRSWIPGRALPGIATCRLWEALARAPRPRSGTLLLVTDVGNDLLYGRSPEILLGWVESCLARLANDDTEIVVTRLPIARMNDLAEWQYRAVLSLLFPDSKLPFATLRERATIVDEGLVRLAERHAAVNVTPRRDWYGIDPIHVRYRCRPTAWREILAHWPSLRLPPGRRPRHVFGAMDWIRQRPAERWLLGLHQTSPQPILRRGGVRLHLF